MMDTVKSADTSGVASQRFCSRPFEWFEIQGRKAYICCPGWTEIKGMDMSGKTVADVWNSSPAQEFRASILDGSFRYCSGSRCPFMNQDGVPNWEKKGSPFMKLKDVTDPRLIDIIENKKTILTDGPLVFNAGYDRSCNLSCPSCRSEVIGLKKEELAIEMDFQEKIIGEIGKKLDVLYITGAGDPFASAVYRKFLRSARAEDYPRLHLHLGTNAVLWTKENWEAMANINQRVKSTHISIDAACAETYAKNRRGGDWGKLIKNLEFISRLRREGPLNFVTLSFVVQENNYKEMPAFIALAERLGFDMVYFQKFEDWGSYEYREYKSQAIHLPLHPQYHQFLEVLSDPCFGKKIVGLFCHMEYRQKALAIKKIPGGFWLLGRWNAVLRFASLVAAAFRRIGRELRKLLGLKK